MVWYCIIHRIKLSCHQLRSQVPQFAHLRIMSQRTVLVLAPRMLIAGVLDTRSKKDATNLRVEPCSSTLCLSRISSLESRSLLKEVTNVLWNGLALWLISGGSGLAGAFWSSSSPHGLSSQIPFRYSGNTPHANLWRCPATESLRT